jgi:hypothetical protein
MWLFVACVSVLGCATGSGKGCDGNDSRSGFDDVYSEEIYIKLEPIATSQIQEGRLVLRGVPSPENIEQIKTFYDRAKEVEPDAEIYCLEAFFDLVREQDIGKRAHGLEYIDTWEEYFCDEIRVYSAKPMGDTKECLASMDIERERGFHEKNPTAYNDYRFYFFSGSGDPRKVRPYVLNDGVEFYVEAGTDLIADPQNAPVLYLVYELNLAQYASRCVVRPAECAKPDAPARTPACGPYASFNDMGAEMSVDDDMSAPQDMGAAVDMPAEEDMRDDLEDAAQDLDAAHDDMGGDTD